MNQAATRRQLAIFMAEKLATEPKRRAEWVRRLAAYLLRHNRAAGADLLLNDIAHELVGRFGLLSLELESARALPAATRRAVGDELRRQTGAERVVVHETVRPELAGGFIARTPDAELDASLRYGLRKLASIA